MSTIPFLSYELSNIGLKGDIDIAMNMLDTGQTGRFVSTINPNAAVEATKDTIFHDALRDADLLIPDGIGIVLGCRMLGMHVPERVAGSDFFAAFSMRAQERGGVSYFFLGSSDAVLAAIVQRMAKDYPNIKIAGTLSPPFKPEFSEAENAAMCEKVNASGATVLWVGMTAPKQEKWIFANRHRLKVVFAAAVGAVFDFYAGTKARAPEWSQRMGFEWLHRLFTEPKRVWRRYIINNPKFVLMILRERFRLLKQPSS